ALCARELESLRGVRRGLRAWSPPEWTAFQPDGTVDSLLSRPRSRMRFLHEIPVWAQVAAALLVLGVSAGIANLDVRYDENGLSIRTGWLRTAGVAPSL